MLKSENKCILEDLEYPSFAWNNVIKLDCIKVKVLLPCGLTFLNQMVFKNLTPAMVMKDQQPITTSAPVYEAATDI